MEDLLGREDQVALVEMEVRTGLTVVQEEDRTVQVLGVVEAQKTLAEVEGRPRTGHFGRLLSYVHRESMGQRLPFPGCD